MDVTNAAAELLIKSIHGFKLNKHASPKQRRAPSVTTSTKIRRTTGFKYQGLTIEGSPGNPRISRSYGTKGFKEEPELSPRLAERRELR